MNQDKKRHQLLKILSNERYGTSYDEKDSSAVSFETIEKNLNLSRWELDKLTSELFLNEEIKYYQGQFLGLYVEREGFTAYTNKKYLKRNKSEQWNNIKNWIQTIVPVLSLLVALGALWFRWEVTQTEANEKTEKTNHHTIEIKDGKENGKLGDKLEKFLENPINLEVFKKLKSRDYITTSVSNGADYYFLPKFEDSIFYTYYYPVKNFNDSKQIDQIVVFKYGKNKHTYEGETEILIELRIFNKDLDLGKANLVGLTKTELESEFGVNYLNFENGIAYSNKNRVLILELESSKVKSYRYIKLSAEKIDNDLLGQIIK